MAKRKLEVQIVGDASSLKRALGDASGHVATFQRSLGSRVASAAFTGVAAGAAAVGAGLIGAVKASASFEKQMSSLKSVTDANAKTMAAFKKEAIDAGIKTKYSANEAAQAQIELAKGGLSVKDIMGGGLSSALALAAAGNLDLGDAAATTANAMNLFGLKGKAAGMIADELATAANATTADVGDFGMALAAGGSVAKSAGLSFTDTTVALEALAASGIKNSDAGTSLKTALIQLIKPTKQQKAETDKLGLSFIDSHGKMKSLTDISEMLRSKMGGMTKAQRTAALATIAGTDGVRTLTSLYDAGPAKLEKYRKGLERQGTAAKVAAVQQDNLAGRFEQFKGTMETVAIVVGDKLRPTIEKVLAVVATFAQQLLSGEGAGGKFRDAIVNAFTTVKTTVLDVVASVKEFAHEFQDGQGKAVALGAALAGLAAGVAVVKTLGAVTKAWAAAQLAIDAAMSANPIVIAIAAIAALGVAIYIAYQKSETFRNAVNGVFSAVKTALSATVNWIKGAVQTVVNEVSQWKLLFAVVAAAWKVQFEVIKTALTVVLATVKVIVAAVVTAVRVGWAVLGPIVAGLWGGIKAVISGALNVIKGLIKVFGGVLKGNWSQIWSGIKETLSGVWGVIKGIVQAGLGAIVGYFKAVPGRILKALGGLGDTLSGVGKDLVAGLVRGIENSAGDVISAIKNTITDRLPAFVKKALQIQSPSKVMEEIGTQISSGLSVGITKMAGSVKSALMTGILFPVDAAIAKLNAQKDTLQKTWDAIDARAQRSQLVQAIATAKAGAVSASHSTSGGGGLGSAVASGKTSGSAASQIFSFFRANGYSNAQAAAFVGNFTQESGLNPAIVEPNGQGHGLAQWGGGRFAALQQFASSKGTAWTNMQTQLEFVLKELRGPESAAGQSILGAHTLADAVNAVGVKYERFGIAGNRLGPAQDAYNKLSGMFKESSGSSGASKGTASVKALQDKIDRLEAEKRNLPAGKAGTARRKEIGNEIADLRINMRGAKGAAKSGGEVADAIKALNDFDNAAKRAKQQAKIDIKIQHLEQLKAFKDAIQGVRDRLSDMAAQAAQAWRTLRESEIDKTHDAAIKAIGDSADARELASLQQTDADKADAKEKAQLDKDLADAIAAEDVGAQQDAQDAIDAYARKKREDELTANLAAASAAADDAQTAAKTGLDKEEADYQTSLDNRLQALVGNLASSKESYASFVKDVQGVLGPLGLTFTGDAGEEATVNAGPGLIKGPDGKLHTATAFVPGIGYSNGQRVTYADWANGTFAASLTGGPIPHRAAGGRVKAGYPYRVGEFGAETMVPDHDGTIVPSGSSKGGVYVDMRGATIGSSKAARVMTERIAHRVAFGVA